MLKTKAIDLLGGTVSSAADAIGVSYQAVDKWPDDLPDRIADRVIAAVARKYLPAWLLGSPALDYQVAKWLPMDAAPRDGTIVDLWVPGIGRVADCAWHLEKWHHRKQPDVLHQVAVNIRAEATHWMPTPLPPEVV